MRVELSRILEGANSSGRLNKQNKDANAQPSNQDAAYAQLRNNVGNRAESLETLSELPKPIEVLKSVQAHFLENFDVLNGEEQYPVALAQANAISEEVRSSPESAKVVHGQFDSDAAVQVLN